MDTFDISDIAVNLIINVLITVILYGHRRLGHWYLRSLNMLQCHAGPWPGWYSISCHSTYVNFFWLKIILDGIDTRQQKNKDGLGILRTRFVGRDRIVRFKLWYYLTYELVLRQHVSSRWQSAAPNRELVISEPERWTRLTTDVSSMPRETFGTLQVGTPSHVYLELALPRHKLLSDLTQAVAPDDSSNVSSGCTKIVGSQAIGGEHRFHEDSTHISAQG